MSSGRSRCENVGDLAFDPRPVEGAETPSGELAEWLGFPVLPCSAEKRPLPKDWPNTASSDPARIRALWKEHPGPLVGVVTGVRSGFDCLDIDPRHGGDVWFERHRDRLPETRVHRTRSGGLHVLFRHLPGLQNSNGTIAPGMNVRSTGGQIIWWPLERFQARGSLDALAEWPLWLWPALMGKLKEPEPVYPRPKPVSDRAIEGVLRTVSTSAEGQRNAVTYWAACRLKAAVAQGVIGATDARNHLLDAARDAGLPAKEANLTINSAWRGARRG